MSEAKHDAEKLPMGEVDWSSTRTVMDLLGVDVWNRIMASMAEVLKHGERTYGRRTWPRVSTDRYRSALLRHATDEGKDADSSCDHRAHVLVNAAFVVALS